VLDLIAVCPVVLALHDSGKQLQRPLSILLDGLVVFVQIATMSQELHAMFQKWGWTTPLAKMFHLAL
jgi:hypothetical protein